MAKVRITQVRSTIDRPQVQKRTMIALGLRKMNSSVEVELNPATKGMVQRVSHLLKIEEI